MQFLKPDIPSPLRTMDGWENLPAGLWLLHLGMEGAAVTSLLQRVWAEAVCLARSRVARGVALRLSVAVGLSLTRSHENTLCKHKPRSAQDHWTETFSSDSKL